LFSKIAIVHRVKKICAKVFEVAAAAAETEGFFGTGTYPKIFAPLVFVVFKSDELVLQFKLDTKYEIFQIIIISHYF
jgi:hypothetical protein